MTELMTLAPLHATSPPRPPLGPDGLGELLDRLFARYRLERPRLDRIAKWHSGKANDLYVPAKVTQEYSELVDQSRFNVLPLVEKTVRQALSIDGYRPTNAAGRGLTPASTPAWRIWQANKMDSRQSKLWGTAVRFGWSYAVVTPGRPFPVITPWTARQLVTIWADSVNDEFPLAAMIVRRPLEQPGAVIPHAGTATGRPGHVDEGSRLTILDDLYRYELTARGGQWMMDPEADYHGLGVCPVIRFPDEEPTFDEPDAYAPGKIEPLIPAQRQVDQITYSLAMALQYSAFRQRYVTGMTVEKHANGTPIEPFNVGVDRLLAVKSADARFGEFAQTDVTGYLNARDRVLAYIGSVSQIPPHNLVTGSTIANLSAEALASLQYGHRRDLEEHERLFGESTELMFRLCGVAMGDAELASDVSARVHWADTTPRTLAEEADAYGKMATMMGIPPRMLWRRLSGVTDQELAEWEAAALDDQQQRVVELADMATETSGADETGDPPAP